MNKITFYIRWCAIGVAWVLAAALAWHHPLMGGMPGSEMSSARHVDRMSYDRVAVTRVSALTGLQSTDSAAGAVVSCPLMHGVLPASPGSQNDGSREVRVALGPPSSAPGYCLRLPDPQARAPSAATLQIFRL